MHSSKSALIQFLCNKVTHRYSYIPVEKFLFHPEFAIANSSSILTFFSPFPTLLSCVVHISNQEFNNPTLLKNILWLYTLILALPFFFIKLGKFHVTEVYLLIVNESVAVPDYMLRELILKDTNHTFDSLVTDSKKADYSFTLFELWLKWIWNSAKNQEANVKYVNISTLIIWPILHAHTWIRCLNPKNCFASLACVTDTNTQEPDSHPALAKINTILCSNQLSLWYKKSLSRQGAYRRHLPFYKKKSWCP